MLPASLIFRAFPHRDDTSYASAQTRPHPRYGYLVYFDGLTTRHRYIPRTKIDSLMPLTNNYRKFCKWMKEIRFLNKQIVELLDKIAEVQTLPAPMFLTERRKGKNGRKPGIKK